ncbi:MAG: serine/threonine protein kinase [Planctomycetes bacterium]|nr:serine/threonine protein kinase [Planctomycetota bacterium]
MIETNRFERGIDVDDAAAPGRAMDWETFFRNYRKPDFVPGFTILNKLGSGVFGEVYKARRTSIGKLYAIKFLRLQDERLHEQVVREIESVDHFAQVDHPNLVSIEDRGEICGIPYIVMGYAGDDTLKSLLVEGAMSAERAIPLIRQIIRGVKALHEHSIIHFDLKPANVFIKGDVARVGDYGLSKLMTESRATLSMGRGTPYYMAPEMLQRRGDARSDVYSLGVILFEMLVGDVPFKGETEWEILKRHETETPLIPDVIPFGLRTFVKQCLGKDPQTRFINAGGMLTAFEVAAGDHPVAAPSGVSAATPPPLPVAPPPGESASTRVGAKLGRMAATGKLSIERVRTELQDVLGKVRSQTGQMVSAAKSNFNASQEPRNPAKVARRNARRDARRIARRIAAERPSSSASRVARAGTRGVGQLLVLPFTLLSWTLRNAVQVVVVAAIIVAVCACVHLGLEAAIL